MQRSDSSSAHPRWRSYAGVFSLVSFAGSLVIYRGLQTASVAQVLAFCAAFGFSIVLVVIAFRRGGVGNLILATLVTIGQLGLLYFMFIF